MLRYLEITCLLLVALWTAGCSGSDSNVVPAAGGGVVNLCIAVSTSDSQPLTRASRAIPNDTVNFEPSVSDYELINTLRVIIANSAGTVELNEFYGSLENVVSKITDIIFTTKEFGKRDIYIIANEASVPSSAFDFKIMPGDKVDPSILDVKLATSAAGSPLVDNTGDEKHYIPMAEHFEVDIQAPPVDYEGDYWQYANLFVTRAATKFSFSIETAKPVAPGNSVTVKQAVISSIGDKEYLFPKNTVYSPAKYVDTKPLPDNLPYRMITAYSVPGDSKNNPVTFDFGNVFHFTSSVKTPLKYSPHIYYPETIFNGGYTVTFSLDIDGEPLELSAKLPNMPSLPRNTHIVIFVQINPVNLTCEVDAVPYLGVELDPIFGFDDLLDKPIKPAPDPENPDIEV